MTLQIVLIYHFVLAIAIFCGVKRYKFLDTGSRVITILLFLTLIFEILAVVSGHIYHTNALVYNIFDPIQFFFISLYFNRSVDVFKKNNIAIYIGTVIAIVGLLNVIFRKRSEMDSTFLLIESFFTIAFALFSLYRQFLFYEQLDVIYYPHFWFSVILLFFWSITFMQWGLYNIILLKYKNFWHHTWLFIWSINIITYLSMAFVFIFYKKMHTLYDER